MRQKNRTADPIARAAAWFVVFFLNLFAVTNAQSFGFRVYLNDKGDANHSVDYPSAFLSEEAIERRTRNAIFVDETDLPIAPLRLEQLAAEGCEPVVVSRWLSTVVVMSEDSTVASRIEHLAFVDSVKWVWKGRRESNQALFGNFQQSPRDTTLLTPSAEPLKVNYGYAEEQIKMLDGIRLHGEGYRGRGISVAIIDAGFLNADRLSVLQSAHIAGTRNMVFPSESVYNSDEHGTKVLSCMAANAPGLMIGTAPEATYWLIKSEDGRSEFPIEEDYWAAAIEFADSVGVTVVSSSLGYFTFDNSTLNYSTTQLDGRTAFVTQAAEIAANKGMLLFVSAGNEGTGSWRKITFPSDAPGLLAVGAIDADMQKASFSSFGFSEDMRVKPDIVALGHAVTVVDGGGEIRTANGTSFSTPILAGLGVCLWQALPWLSNRELIGLIQQSASQYKRPDVEVGYGVPDFFKALQIERRNVRE